MGQRVPTNFSGSSQKPNLLHHPALHRGILNKQLIWGPWKHSPWHSLWDPSAVLTQPANEELLSVTPLGTTGISSTFLPPGTTLSSSSGFLLQDPGEVCHKCLQPSGRRERAGSTCQPDSEQLPSIPRTFHLFSTCQFSKPRQASLFKNNTAKQFSNNNGE